METKDELKKQPHEVINDCIINTYVQSQKSKEFEQDAKEMTDAFHKFTGKYGDKIAGFYLLNIKNGGWMINIATDGEII
jgi:hypothetical protein